MKIRVPATSANLGPGFDSCGVALSKYLFLEILGEAHTWQIDHELGEDIPHDQTNLVIQTALKIAPTLKPQHLKMTSQIPAARGLGSSSTAIVAGIELANRLSNLGLTRHQKVSLATSLEGHPDNVAPAICGDFVVASYVNDDVFYVKHHFPKCDVVAFIPDEALLTSESRQVLPSNLPYSEAVKASSISNVMIAAVLNSNLELAGQMMEKDLWHEKYRAALVPHLAAVRQLAHQYQAYGCVLSGAGPTILTFISDQYSNAFANSLEQLPYQATVEIMAVDMEGIQVF